MSHHSEDYKEVAVKHYLESNDDIQYRTIVFKYLHFFITM